MAIPISDIDIYQERLDIIKGYVPDLFVKSTPKRILYIGAKEGRWDYVPELYEAGHRITVLEVFKKNYDAICNHRYFELVVLGDVRYISYMNLWKEQFDVIFWWHGPEHLRYQEAEEVILDLEEMATQSVILGTPWGDVPQGKVGQNVYEAHLSTWGEHNFTELGYQVTPHHIKDMMGSCLIAYKGFR
jgi:hypothetical protein